MLISLLVSIRNLFVFVPVNQLQPCRFTRVTFSLLRKVSILREFTLYYYVQCFKLLVMEQDIVGFSEWFMENIRYIQWCWKRLRERGSGEGIQTSDSRRRCEFQNGTSCEEKWFAFLIERSAGTTLYKLGQR